MESYNSNENHPEMDPSVDNLKGKDTIVPISYVETCQIIDSKPVLKEKESAVLVRDLCKGYDRKGPRVLNNFSMNVKKGTIYGLLGSSGCGKTTALSCIVGLKKWESGEILVFGEKPGTKESGIPGRRLGFVPQDIALYDQLDAFENIQYYGRLYGMSSQEISEQWSVLVNLLQLPSDFRLVQNLSGGQKRRTSLAIALVHTPELLILDEPTVGLDPLLRESVWQHLYKLVQMHGTSIIITTHYIEESRNSNTIGVMRHGHLLVEDSPSILMAQYKTDLLEDVVLKLCWEDTKRALKRGSTVSLGNNNNNRHLFGLDKDSGDSDDDSGTGTDDNVDLDVVAVSRSNPDLSSGTIDTGDCDSSSGASSTNNANSSEVPKKAKKNVRFPPTAPKRSKSSEVSGVLFQSRWKPELDSIVVSDVNSVEGNYKQSYEFDFTPPKATRPRPPLQHKSSWDIYKERERSKTGAKKVVSDIFLRIQRVWALCCVVYLSLLRHPVFFLAALILPAGEVILTISSVGKEPIGLRMAVVNEEMPDWLTNCPWDEINIKQVSKANGIDPSLLMTSTVAPIVKDDDDVLECDFSALSCKYLNLAAHGGIMDLIPYGSTEEAVQDVEKGKLWGYIHFRTNYSQHMIDRLATKQFAYEESINGSTISLRMDMSQYLGSVIVIQEVFDALQGYIQQLIGSCDLGARQAEIPLHFRNPVYGRLDANYHDFLIPGVLANILFMMTFAISGLMFITDLKLGTMGRARVAGMRTVELFLAYTITQGSIVVIQVIVCSLCLKIGFNFEIAGSITLYIACTLLLGMCGQAFGLVMGIVSQDEIEALISALFILPLMLLFGGVIWPLDCMAPFWKYVGASLPTTLITESLRSITLRGVGITHGLLYPGIIVTSGWLVFFWILALIAYRICIK